jgi:hypothetical protein
MHNMYELFSALMRYISSSYAFSVTCRQDDDYLYGDNNFMGLALAFSELQPVRWQ